MFNFQAALLRWNGQEYSLNDLQERLRNLRLENIGELPPEIGVRELLLMALDHHWIVEEQSGQLRVQVPTEAVA
jgi:hypothetical protein